MSFGRIYGIDEEKSLSIRVELMNVFNRTQIPDVGVGNDIFENAINNSGAPQLRDADGNAISGFGFVDAIDAGGARTGQIVARFRF